MAVNFVIPLLLKPVGARKLLIASWILCIGGLILLCRMGDGNDYWRLCLPGMILYIAGVGTVYFVGNVTVVATATEQTQGTVSGVYNVSHARRHMSFIFWHIANGTTRCSSTSVALFWASRSLP